MGAVHIVAAALVALLLAVGAQASTGVKPTLELVSHAPLVVTGTGFRSGERVRLLISAPDARSRTVIASRRGRFRVVLRVVEQRCAGIVVQAIGSRGSRAMADRPGLDCSPLD